MSFRSLPLGDAVERKAAVEGPQKDDLCGPFWVTVGLRALGVPVRDEDAAALAAGTRRSRDPDRYRPPGAPPRQDYRADLPLAADDDHDAGTSGRGVANAVVVLSGGASIAMPVRAPVAEGTAERRWTTSHTLGLLERIRALPRAVVIANVATAEFAAPGWRERPSAEAPRLPWDVGHFVAVTGWTQAGDDTGATVRILDTSEAFGADGIIEQPVERVAAALTRPGRTPGGVLVVVPLDAAAAVVDAAHAVGLEAEFWD